MLQLLQAVELVQVLQLAIEPRQEMEAASVQVVFEEERT